MSERGIWLDGSHLLLAAPTVEAVFLGLADGTPLFADDVSAAEPARGRPAGLREAATELPAEEVALPATRARCWPGTAATASAPAAAHPPSSAAAATSVTAPPATPTTSRAPTRWRSCA